MKARLAACAMACAAVAGIAAVAADAATGPPAPVTHGGATASAYAALASNVTAIAIGDGTMFAGTSGTSEKTPNGGAYVVANGTATEIPNSPVFVGGMAWNQSLGALFVAGAWIVDGAPSFQIQRWSGFTGTGFSSQSTIYTAPKGFEGFNGLAFSPHGRLFVGVDAGLLNNNDHGPRSLSPYLYDILSMSPTGAGLEVFARGMRQPWQLAFAPGSSAPFVSDLGQDGPKSVEKLGPPDFLLRVHHGDDYGFPRCNRTSAGSCAGDTRPLRRLAPHFDPMGLAIIGRTLYLGSFLGSTGKGGALYATGFGARRLRAVVTGFPAATDTLATDGTHLFVGGSNAKGAGVIYEVTP